MVRPPILEEDEDESQAESQSPTSLSPISCYVTVSGSHTSSNNADQSIRNSQRSETEDKSDTEPEPIIDLSSGSASPADSSPPSSDEDDNGSSAAALPGPSALESQYLMPSTSNKVVVVVSSSEDDDEDLNVKFVGELRKLQKSFSSKLDKYDKQLKRREKLKKLKALRKAIEVIKELERNQVPNEAYSSPVAEPLEFETEKERELKRKLAMVTQEMSQSRMDQMKKLKRGIVREPMVIEIPDFPMEYYKVNVDSIKHRGGIEGWYARFNRHPKVREQPAEYKNWIQSRINDFLPEVLNILWKHSEDAIKPVSEQIRGCDLLNCRLVSKPWKDSIDKFLQTSSLEEKPSTGDSGFQIFTKISSESLEKFVNWLVYLEKRKHPYQHPFPSRDLFVKDVPLQEEQSGQRFKVALYQCLEMFGQNIQSFSYLGYRHRQPSTVTMFTHLLEKMPQLKSLSLSFPDTFISTQESSLGPAEVNPSNNKCPIPVLLNLTCLQFRRTPRYLMNSILKLNHHVQNLSILPIYNDQHLCWTDYNGLNGLSQLTFHVSTIMQIRAIENVNWPLKKVTLSSSEVREELIELGHVFQVLQKFSDTLKEVDLTLWVTSSRDSTLRMKLPRLQHLSLRLKESLVGGKISYDFLLPLISLQRLKITLENENESAEEVTKGNLVQVIQLKGYLNRLYDSNIWDIFPALKSVVASGSFGNDFAPREFKYSRK